MPDNDQPTFGQALKEARKRRGISLKEAGARLKGLYSTAETYARIERGQRGAGDIDRAKVIHILIKGLEMRNASEIDRMLALAKLESLSQDEMEQLGLAVAPSLPEPLSLPNAKLSSRRQLYWLWLLVAIGTAVLTWVTSDHALFVTVIGLLYASLFIISVFLESAFETSPVDRSRSIFILFAVVLFTSVGALVADERLIGAGATTIGLPTAGVMLLTGAVIQFFLARRMLPPTILVPARFQTMTAQTAHLKNSCYFILLAILFWLPSYHAAVAFARLTEDGQRDRVERAFSQDLYTSAEVIVLSVRIQLLLLLVIVAVSLYMGSKLLDRLRAHERLNHYTQLFYLRAVVYFLLSLISIGWYSYTTSQLL